VPAKDWEEIGSQEAKPLGNTDIVMNEPKWLSDLRQGGQAGDTPAQAKTLSPQEQQEKKAVVDSLIKRIKNI